MTALFHGSDEHAADAILVLHVGDRVRDNAHLDRPPMTVQTIKHNKALLWCPERKRYATIALKRIYLDGKRRSRDWSVVR